MRRLLGTADATEVEAVVGDVCLRALGAPPGAHELCRASVGVVFGLRLAEGRRVVIKLHRPEVGATYLGAVQEVQRLVDARGLPAAQAGHLPQAHLEVVAGAGHAVPLERSRETAELLRAHWALRTSGSP